MAASETTTAGRGSELMSFLSKFKKVAKGAAREVSADLGKNREFLEACCALSALVATADGVADDSEKRKAVAVMIQNATLGQLYDQPTIESTFQKMLARAGSGSGRQSLAAELQDVNKLPNASEMAPYVYLIAKDVAEADGSIGEKEAKVLATGARLLNVDPTQFEHF
jgi:tellurite resistance protein TerB